MFQRVFKIEDNSVKETLLEIISDKYCRAILDSIMYEAKSAQEISTETGITISTVYRKIPILYDGKLLVVTGNLDEERKSFRYKNRMKSIHVFYHEGKIEVKIGFN